MHKTFIGSITMFILFVCEISYGQFKTTKTFYYKSKELMCASTIIADSTGIFFEAGGCEGTGSVSLGTYKLNKDTITFNCNRVDTFPPILKVEESPANNDSIIKITLQLRYGTALSNYFKIDAIEKTGNFLKECTLNNNGEVFLNSNKYKSLRLTFLDHFYHKWIYINTTTTNLKVTLGLPNIFFYFEHPNTKRDTDKSFIVRKNGLYPLRDTSNEYVFLEE